MKSDSFLKKDPQVKEELLPEEGKAILMSQLAKKKIAPERLHLFLRAFKAEQQLEVWIQTPDGSSWQLFKTIPFCKSSGTLGPKRQEGDRQIPEGVYHINRFNPKSKYHLSLGLDYPNPSDRILGDPKEPGSDIFIHGGCETVGCIPITDEGIEEVYFLAGWAKETNQAEIPVHIYPFRFTLKNWNTYNSEFPQQEPLWRQLEMIYLAFEKEKILPKIAINTDGEYLMML